MQCSISTNIPICGKKLQVLTLFSVISADLRHFSVSDPAVLANMAYLPYNVALPAALDRRRTLSYSSILPVIFIQVGLETDGPLTDLTLEVNLS